MTPAQAAKLWDQYGRPTWPKVVPQVRAKLNGIAEATDLLTAVQAASEAAARAYRLGFKAGLAVGEAEGHKASNRIIIPN